MKESFDQQAAQSPSPSTGSRQTAHRRGKARSSAARSTARALSAAFASRAVETGAGISPAAFPITPRYLWRGNCHRLRVDPPLAAALASLEVMAEPPPPPSPLIFDRRLLHARRRRAASLGPATSCSIVSPATSPTGWPR